MDREDLTDRLAAVERRLTDEGEDCPPLAADAAVAERLDEIEDRTDALDDRLAEVESAVQALRGYVGSVERVNEDVERRANAAVACVERLEDRLDERVEEPREAASGSRGFSDDAERVAVAARDADGGTAPEGNDRIETGRSLAGRLRDALS